MSKFTPSPVPRSKRTFCATPLLAIGLAVASGCGSDPAPEPAQKPDVIVLVIDTLRSDRLGSYGYERDTSPFLDSIAEQGVLFEDTTAQASWTLPSMVSMFSGQYITAWRDRVPTDVPYLPQAFKNAGYNTVGLSANILINEGSGFARGFDHFDGEPGPPFEGDAANVVRARNLPQLVEDMWEPLDKAIATDENGERPPLFLYLQPFDPHAPYIGHQELNTVLPPNGAPVVQPPAWPRDTIATMGPAPTDKDPNWAGSFRNIRLERGRYDQEIRYMDQQLEQAFAELEARGLLENSIIAVLSDHGECLWDRVNLKRPEELATLPPTEFFYQEHGAFLYEEGIDTPFFISGPGLPAGKRVSQAVENLDLFPTLLELCDLPVTEGLHGDSLVDLAHGRRDTWRETVHSNALPCVAVREVATSLKLILPLSPGGRFPDREPELFDLSVDPLERNNLAHARPDDVARLRATIDAWVLEYPTSDTADMPVDAEQQNRLDQLGYTDAHQAE